MLLPLASIPSKEINFPFYRHFIIFSNHENHFTFKVYLKFDNIPEIVSRKIFHVSLLIHEQERMVSPKEVRISFKVRCSLLGFSNIITEPLNLESSSSIFFSSFLGGKKTFKINLSVGRNAIKAANMDDAPGILCILKPSFITDLTNL